MATVKLVDEDCDNPIVKAVFADIKATKKIDFVPNICGCWPRIRSISNFAGRDSRRS